MVFFRLKAVQGFSVFRFYWHMKSSCVLMRFSLARLSQRNGPEKRRLQPPEFFTVRIQFRISDYQFSRGWLEGNLDQNPLR